MTDAAAHNALQLQMVDNFHRKLGYKVPDEDDLIKMLEDPEAPDASELAPGTPPDAPSTPQPDPALPPGPPPTPKEPIRRPLAEPLSDLEKAIKQYRGTEKRIELVQEHKQKMRDIGYPDDEYFDARIEELREQLDTRLKKVRELQEIEDSAKLGDRLPGFVDSVISHANAMLLSNVPKQIVKQTAQNVINQLTRGGVDILASGIEDIARFVAKQLGGHVPEKAVQPPTLESVKEGLSAVPEGIKRAGRMLRRGYEGDSPWDVAQGRDLKGAGPLSWLANMSYRGAGVDMPIGQAYAYRATTAKEARRLAKNLLDDPDFFALTGAGFFQGEKRATSAEYKQLYGKILDDVKALDATEQAASEKIKRNKNATPTRIKSVEDDAVRFFIREKSEVGTAERAYWEKVQAIRDTAKSEAQQATFTQDNVGTKLMQAHEGAPPLLASALRVFNPFVRVPGNVIGKSVEMTPGIGLGKYLLEEAPQVKAALGGIGKKPFISRDIHAPPESYTAPSRDTVPGQGMLFDEFGEAEKQVAATTGVFGEVSSLTDRHLITLAQIMKGVADDTKNASNPHALQVEREIYQKVLEELHKRINAGELHPDLQKEVGIQLRGGIGNEMNRMTPDQRKKLYRTAAQQTIGLGLAGLGAYDAAKGDAAGSYDYTTSGKQEALGIPAGMRRIGETAYDVAAFTPLAAPYLFGSTLYREMTKKERNAFQAAILPILVGIEAQAEAPVYSGIGEITKILRNPESQLGEALLSAARSRFPGPAVRDIAMYLDPGHPQRLAPEIMDKWQGDIPGLRGDLPIKYDAQGRELKSTDNAVLHQLGLRNVPVPPRSPGMQALIDTGAGISVPKMAKDSTDKVTGAKLKGETAKEYSERTQVTGEQVKQYLDNVAAGKAPLPPTFTNKYGISKYSDLKKAPNEIKRAAIEASIEYVQSGMKQYLDAQDAASASTATDTHIAAAQRQAIEALGYFQANPEAWDGKSEKYKTWFADQLKKFRVEYDTKELGGK